jgi:hypothetical protein
MKKQKIEMSKYIIGIDPYDKKQTAVEFISKGLFDILQEAEDNNIFEVGTQNFKRYIEMFLEQAKEMEKQQIIEHSVELAKLLFSNPIEKSGTTPQELVDSYFKNK